MLYYQLSIAEHMFLQSNFASVDEYFTLKTVVLLEPDVSKIDVEYADKFMMLRKRMLFTNQVQGSPKELRCMSIRPSPEHRVVIIGLSLPSLLIAEKLSDFGITVFLVDKHKREVSYREGNNLIC
jgi:hypothetical protein